MNQQHKQSAKVMFKPSKILVPSENWTNSVAGRVGRRAVYCANLWIHDIFTVNSVFFIVIIFHGALGAIDLISGSTS